VTNNEIPTEHPFGKGWRILVIAVFAIVVVAIAVMVWGIYFS